MGLQLFDEQTPIIQLTNQTHVGSVPTPLVVGNAQTNRWRLDSIIVANDDTIPHNICLALDKSGTVNKIGGATIAAGAGDFGVPAVELISTLFGTLDPHQVYDATIQVKIQFLEDLSVGKKLYFTMVGGFV